MANERALLDVMNDPDALNQFFDYSGADFNDGDQVVSDTSVAELFDGLSAEDYPVLSLSAEDMTNGDEWNFMPLVQSTVGLDTPGVQPPWFQPSLVMTGASTMETDVSTSMPIYNYTQSGCSSNQGQSSRSSTVLITNSPLASRLSAVQQTVALGATQSPQAHTGSPVCIQYARSPANSAPIQRQQFVQAQQTPSQQLQVLQQQQPQQHVQYAAAPQVQAAAGSGNTGSGLTLIQMPNGQYVVQQQQQQSSMGSVQQLIGGGHLVIQQQQPSGNLQQLGIQAQQQQQQQQMIQQQALTQGVSGGQIMLQAQQHQMAGQVVIQQQPVVQHQNYISVPQGMNTRPQFNLGSVRGIQLPNGEVQLVNSAQVGMLGGGSIAAQGQQIVLQQQPSMSNVLQSNTSIMHGNSTVLHGNAGAPNVVYQTMPLTSGSGCISATNFVQINQFGGGNMQSQQVLQPSDQQGSSILLSLNQSTSPAPTGDQFTDRNVATGGSDLLVQINGQTYRLHNVQQTPPQTAPSPPVQIIASNVQNAVQLNARSATPHLLQQQVQQSQQQQQHPAQVVQVHQMVTQQSAAQVMQTVSSGRASSPSIPVRQLAVSSQSLQQMQLAIGRQATSVGSGQLSVQTAAHAPNQSNNAPLGNQTITLTQSQLAIIQQAPPNKQLKLLQILQRQQMLRAMPGNQSVTMRPEAVANGHAVSSSVASNTFLQVSGSPSGIRPMPFTALSQQPAAATLPANSGSLRPGQTVLPRSIQGMVSEVHKSVSAVQIARPGQNIITASQAQGGVPVSGVRTISPDLATQAFTRVLPRPPIPSAALSAITTSGNQLHVTQTVLPQVNAAKVVGMASMSASSVNQNVNAVRLPALTMVPTASTSQKSTDSSQLATSNAATSTSAAKLTTVRLTTQQQTLLLKVQNQLQTLSNVSQRTAEQDRFLQMLMNAQQQILAQGQAQLQNQLQAEKFPAFVAPTVSSPSNARLAVTTSTSATALRPTATVLRPPLPASIPRLTALSQIGCRAEAPSTNVLSSSQRPLVAQTTVSSKLPTNAPTAVSATQNQSMDNLFRSFPNFREKLEAEFAKMTPERREWIKSNQSLIFAKLQQRQMEIQQQQQKAIPTASGSGVSSSEVKPINVSLSTSVAQPVMGTAVNVLSTGPTLTRKQLFQMYLLKDQKRATQPDCKTPFDSQKDILKRLVPFHVYQTGMNTVEQIDKAETLYEEHARQLLDRKETMFNKYRHLLLLESMKKDSSADAVMLGRMFLNDERSMLKEDRRLVAENPASFVPRPVLDPVKVEKIEPAQSKNEVKTEAPYGDCTEEKTEIKLESVSNIPVAEYVVRPSKGLTVVFKNRASPSRSPPSQAATFNSSTDSIMDVRVKLERCDNDEPRTPSPKRARLAINKNCSSNVINRSIPRCLETEASGDASEDDAAVASLLGCNAQDDCFSLGRLDRGEVSMSAQIIEDKLSDDEDVEADSYVNCEAESLFMHTGTRENKHDKLFTDNDDSQNYQEEQGFFSGFEESVDDTVESFDSCTEHMQTDSQLMSAVGTLMADLGQLNADAIALSASQSVQQYSSVTNRESGNGSNSAVQSHMQYAVNSIIGFQQHSTSQTSVVTSSSCFDRTRISAAGSDHDSDLDAAVKSILT